MTEGQQATFKAVVLHGPNREWDGGRIVDLCQITNERFGVAYGKGGMLGC